MILTEYDEEETMRMFKEEFYEDGFEDGQKEGLNSALAALIASGDITPERAEEIRKSQSSSATQ